MILAKDLDVRMRILIEINLRVLVCDVSGDYQKLTPLSVEKRCIYTYRGCWCE